MLNNILWYYVIVAFVAGLAFIVLYLSRLLQQKAKYVRKEEVEAAALTSLFISVLWPVPIALVTFYVVVRGINYTYYVAMKLALLCLGVKVGGEEDVKAS